MGSTCCSPLCGGPADTTAQNVTYNGYIPQEDYNVYDVKADSSSDNESGDADNA